MSIPEPATPKEAPREHHVCPWWVGYLLASPLRKLRENPEKLLRPYVEPGMVVVDVGCSMGFFSLPLAQMVGADGRVHCLDVAPKALRTLEHRARRRGLDRIVETRLVFQESLGLETLDGGADFVLAAHVVHETRYPETFLRECHDSLVGRGVMLILEPRGHVREDEFERTRTLAEAVGFQVLSTRSGRTMEMVLQRGRR
jgi:2-polyprenyl-3-methyl-5-hydroxy-6-metoxy-1,4-benzoquinol methylase